ncbi:MAG: AAA family ATPase, partial [Methanolinea sp.]|nr:AAA family ATPase [Methanolinea sp.]
LADAVHSIGETIAQHRHSPIPGVDDKYIEEQLKPVTPEIDPGLFRKYVAYARRTCFPRLTEEAREALSAYYMQLRDLAAGSDKPVPITARQLEALVRLAEASARIRLSQEIGREDAERVIKIVDACLREVAYDPKTGTFEIDRVSSGITKGRRDLIRTIKQTIRQIQKDTGNDRVAVAELMDILVPQGFSREEIKAQIELFLREGEAMEPKSGFIKLI